MCINNLVPNNKSDFMAIERIKKATKEEIEPFLEEIFEWIEDINWPIAESLCMELVTKGDSIIPFVERILESPDGLREYAIYHVMMPLFTKHQLQLLKKVLVRISNNPSDIEHEQEYDKIVLNILEKLK
jgi:hypothetical protein